ncbi:MAG: hypothetical protein ACI8XB_000135 [Patiriisocius sp.]|jgi:hypothetical protein
MKKLILSLLICLFTATTFAQDDRPFRIGFAILPSASSIKPEGEIFTKNSGKFGFAYGLLAEFNFGAGNYAFASGLMINSLGGTINNTNYHTGDTSVTSFGVVEEKYSLQYIQIPLTLKLKTNEIGYLTYFGQFGLDLGFRIKSKADITGVYDFETIKETDINISEDIQPIRSALNVGAGVEYNISADTYLVTSIIWNNGLTNLFKKKAWKSTASGLPDINDGSLSREEENIKAINNYFGVSIAMFF